MESVYVVAVADKILFIGSTIVSVIEQRPTGIDFGFQHGDPLIGGIIGFPFPGGSGVVSKEVVESGVDEGREGSGFSGAVVHLLPYPTLIDEC